ncbi:hypothetical protein BN8_03643 [Fibrisoma limi BUZ 3]|uniref:Uncharacterized protein n=1 Tax=Fibrisoma limi BUZ 3 TaxID=1185876 RepID=I2GKP3_9BACT|nr:hypothetical protein [Fibrisoma limi]CCH54469.1 hypothetical protein BN8_03643 [Fibrisoma limi BUZ 3]
MKTYRIPFNDAGQPIEHPAGTFQTKPALLVEDVYTVLQETLQLGEYGVSDQQRVLAMTRLLEQIYQKRQVEK